MDSSYPTTLTDVLGDHKSAVETTLDQVDHSTHPIDSMDGVGVGVGVESADVVRAIQQSLPATPLDTQPPTPATLHSLQQNHSAQPSPLPADIPPPPGATPSEADPTAEGPSKPGRKPKLPEETSAADSKRREANRLAAERSRGRQQEKVVALEMAVQALGEENLRLKGEIARLEGRDVEDPSAMGIDTSVVPDQAVTAAAVVEAANAAAAAAAAEADKQAQAQADTQSRNILAALLSQPGVPLDEALAAGLAADDADTATWMHGVESLFKDAEASGRLGELAAVAAGQGEGSSSMNGSQQLQAHDAVSLGDVLINGGDRIHGVLQQITIPATGGTSIAAPAVAVAINSEMEKLLRDELAETRASIARVEQELARVRGQSVFDTVDPSIPMPMSLPPELFEEGVDELSARGEKINADIEQLNSEAAVLREVVARMTDAHAEEHDKVSAIAHELRALDMDGGEQERDKVSAVLKALRATITNLMTAPGGDLNSSPLVTPFSSPATARRRRGRPPKEIGAFSNVLPYAALPLMHMSPPPIPAPSASTEGSPAFPESPTVRPMGSSARARSRLVHEIVPSDSDTVEIEAGPRDNKDDGDDGMSAATPLEAAGPSSVPPTEEALRSGASNTAANAIEAGPSDEMAIEPSDQVTIEQPGSQPVDDVHALVAQAQAHAHAHNDYLMSHLTEMAEGSRPIPLDSSSFAAFMPQSPNQNVDSSMDPSALGPPAPPPVPQADDQAVPSPIQDPPQPNVLSRLKRGPPGSCDICGRTETTVWRKLSLAGEEHKVCNPCGLYHSKFGIIRPPELWGDGKSVKKRRTSARIGYDASPNAPAAKKKRKSGGGAATKYPQQPHEYEDLNQVVLEHQAQQQQEQEQAQQQAQAQAEAQAHTDAHTPASLHLHEAINGNVNVNMDVDVDVDVDVHVNIDSHSHNHNHTPDDSGAPGHDEPQGLNDVGMFAVV